ncbi:HK97-gp10 family putative phage morphogenesis protein [Mesorhizobium sp. DCY119]|uniref:HK97-gp10 family putative phage morphogenesis protein n=1 Tax=Mesorhizobium sp. DCY119 TaxID=2108445 RepID=UPI000E6D0ED5|nr:HK97-gp10 family putative phage morphogenesis protein [Mesorhizobium sp. DCY119]RJG44915.1 HK97 gp10 family phage protein [Mesorhizobium sp. DCY119]
MNDGGIGSLKRRLAAIPKAAKERAAIDTLAAAEDMANIMRSLAPEDEGDLKASIAVTPGGQSTPAYSQPGGASIVPENQVAITAGNTAVRYPHLVEHGTEKAEAQPFFWPGYRLGKKKALNKIKAGIRKAIKEAK